MSKQYERNKMINQDKITAIKVAHKLSGHSYADIPTPSVKPNFGGDDTKYRVYEIYNTSDAGKLYLSWHHLRNAINKVIRYAELANGQEPQVVLGGNHKLDFKYMCKHFQDDINSRMEPALKGLVEFTTPHNEANDQYQKIMKAYEAKVAAVKLIYPTGNKRYSNSYRALMPHFKKVLVDLNVFLGEAIIDYSPQ